MLKSPAGTRTIFTLLLSVISALRAAVPLGVATAVEACVTVGVGELWPVTGAATGTSVGKLVGIVVSVRAGLDKAGRNLMAAYPIPRITSAAIATTANLLENRTGVVS